MEEQMCAMELKISICWHDYTYQLLIYVTNKYLLFINVINGINNEL